MAKYDQMMHTAIPSDDVTETDFVVTVLNAMPDMQAKERMLRVIHRDAYHRDMLTTDTRELALATHFSTGL